MLKSVTHEGTVCDHLEPQTIVYDYRLSYASRAASLLARKEVLSGRAKFGIFGDGKEVAQVALAHFFAAGDWRSGYYRDQTLMFALQMSSIRQFFSQLYADTDRQFEPASGGRQMVCHFATKTHDENGNPVNQMNTHNSAADLSPVAAQMGRAVGLAYASKLYRNVPELEAYDNFSSNGSEIAFTTIGDAGTSEGLFWEAMNAAAVLQIPLVTLVWDDNYGISVPISYQTVKQSIYNALAGFKTTNAQHGMDLYQVRGWDYNNLYMTFRKAIPRVRKTHVPALFHITELTQPQGHSTSGSHERYKTQQRLQYEAEIDCLASFRRWILTNELATENDLNDLEKETETHVQEQRDLAWENFRQAIETDKKELLSIYQKLQVNSEQEQFFQAEISRLDNMPSALQKDLAQSMYRAIIAARNESSTEVEMLKSFYHTHAQRLNVTYSSHLYCESEFSACQVAEVKPVFSESDAEIDGRLVILKCFENLFHKDARFFAIGEDIGKLGGVNLCFQGLQEKFSQERVTDTGIREATILGQGIGAALRGLRPIVDIQYLDYLLYCLQLLSDDLACLHYRTAGGQLAPVIIRTKGHRLEGIWHTGSMLGMLIHAIRGVYLCTPRNMVQALGMYNTLAQGNDAAVVIEVLNGYRVKERLPANHTDFTVPLGIPETLRAGSDITLVTYGACVRIALEACQLLSQLDVDVELIDVQCLLPFDKKGEIVSSLQKTNAIAFLDEDVPGGATSYMLQQVLETGGGYDWLDVPPVTITAKDHRGAYGSDGDYYSKPNAEQICTAVYNCVRQRDPHKYKRIFSSQT